jgi:hypothetical protein
MTEIYIKITFILTLSFLLETLFILKRNNKMSLHSAVLPLIDCKTSWLKSSQQNMQFIHTLQRYIIINNVTIYFVYFFRFFLFSTTNQRKLTTNILFC